MSIERLLRDSLKKNEMEVSEAQLLKIIQFLELLTQWNKVFNLTAIHGEKEMIYLHIIDSLVIQPYLIGDEILDVGTGAGIPGIPLAIMMPDRHFTLMDKNGKKIRFLTQVLAELQLSNVKLVQDRVQDFEEIERFDSIVSRAFASLETFVTLAAPLLQQNGVFFAMKGKYKAQEIEDLPTNFVIDALHRLSIKGLESERHLICIRKRNVS